LNEIGSGAGLFAKIHSEDSYTRALRLSDTGRLLGWLTQYCGINMNDLYITNAFKCLLPNDEEPKLKDYMICVNILKKQILKAKPKKIVVYGTKPTQAMWSERTQLDLSTGISTVYGIPTMFMYHPRKLHDMKTPERQKYFLEIRNFLKNDNL
jgi:uracil-DNA glycosylase family 4